MLLLVTELRILFLIEDRSLLFILENHIISELEEKSSSPPRGVNQGHRDNREMLDFKSEELSLQSNSSSH